MVCHWTAGLQVNTHDCQDLQADHGRAAARRLLRCTPWRLAPVGIDGFVARACPARHVSAMLHMARPDVWGAALRQGAGALT